MSDEHSSHHVNYFLIFGSLCVCTSLSVIFDVLDLSNKFLLIALVLGDENAPIPEPDSTMPMTTCKSGESRSNREKTSIAAADIAIPTTAGQRVPILSDSLPMSGPITAIQIAPGTIRSPARLAG